MKPYYEHKGITIYHGDCREVLRKVGGNVIVADPPYGVGKAPWDSRFMNEWMERQAYLPVLVATLAELKAWASPNSLGYIDARPVIEKAEAAIRSLAEAPTKEK